MRTDLLLVGGGLANALVALRLSQLPSAPRFLLLEAGHTLGGNHTWSFHGTDLTPEGRDLVAPLVEHTWRGHDVRFPGFVRTLEGSYHSIRSRRLHEIVTTACGDAVRLGAEVVELDPVGVRLSDGTRVEATGVVDGRGFVDSAHLELGYQKFLGRVLELARPHGLERPILMDATVPQRDGFRFVYVLPLSETELLVEDTRYSDSRELTREAMRDDILDYARESLGVEVSGVADEEEGVLPVVLSGDIDAFWAEARGIARSGLRAALFHPTTGYSLAEAASLALAVSRSDVDADALFELTRKRSQALFRETSFFRFLNRMLFRAAAPEERYRVLAHFYRLPEPLIERFYARRPSTWDEVRLLMGRPPVPLSRALRCLHPRNEGGITPRSGVARQLR